MSDQHQLNQKELVETVVGALCDAIIARFKPDLNTKAICWLRLPVVDIPRDISEPIKLEVAASIAFPAPDGGLVFTANTYCVHVTLPGGQGERAQVTVLSSTALPVDTRGPWPEGPFVPLRPLVQGSFPEDSVFIAAEIADGRSVPKGWLPAAEARAHAGLATTDATRWN